MKESTYIIVKRDGETVKYLRHEGHSHFWTQAKREAMEYTRIDVAQALAEKNGGKIEAA